MILSLLIPGLGQALRGNAARGAAIFCAVASALIFTLWYRQPVWYVFPALIWWWNVWDAHKTAPVWMPFAAWMTMALGIGVAVTEFDLMALWQNAERGAVILRPMLRPDFFEPNSWRLSFNGGYILEGIQQTLGMALLATTFGAILAVPFGFLAARNLMSANIATRAIYTITRAVLNIARSIESLILAIVFVKVVGLGTFAGFIALTIHTIAALGKLFSEIIEAIDPGPIEAIRSTGATWLQTVRYAVIPQIVPQFTALTIYRWDINVRTSTIIGLVGGGGIGFFLNQWIRNGDYRAVSASFIAIALIVVVMDFLSARIRAKLEA
ncbi:MAG: phosphonate ABC transporter, permease protein PhnE [Anaerolineae bacterium]|nr:phosphonate ABC transporter, permease protein PhnE [Anaerolineae bacterium]